jgi:hypothetical protein
MMKRGLAWEEGLAIGNDIKASSILKREGFSGSTLHLIKGH